MIPPFADESERAARQWIEERPEVVKAMLLVYSSLIPTAI